MKRKCWTIAFFLLLLCMAGMLTAGAAEAEEVVAAQLPTPVLTSALDFKAAIPLGGRVSFLPDIRLRNIWHFGEKAHDGLIHTNFVGGRLAGGRDARDRDSHGRVRHGRPRRPLRWHPQRRR